MGMHGGRLPGQVQALGMHPTRVGHPARASGAARVQEQPPPAHQDKLLQQRRRQQHLLGAQHGHGRPAGALRGHGWPAGTHDGHTRAGDGRRTAVQNGRGVLADRPVGAGVGCSADGVMGDKGACCCVPDARVVLYSGIRAALHVCGVCCGRYVLLVPLAPLASLGLGPAQAACVWPPQAVQTPFRWLWGVCYGTGGGAEQNCTI